MTFLKMRDDASQKLPSMILRVPPPLVSFNSGV